MPLTTWEEYEIYKKKYTDLTKELSGCFDDSLYKAGKSPAIDFDASKAQAVCKRFLPYSLADADIEITTP